MKLEHRLLLTGFLASAFLVSALSGAACVSGTVVGGGVGGQGENGTGGTIGQDGTGGTSGPRGTGGTNTIGTGGNNNRGTGGNNNRGTGGGAVTGTGGGTVTGTGGMASSTCTGGVVTAQYPVIDDIEKEGNGANGGPCINGYWYTYNDGSSGTQVPPAMSPTFNATAITDRPPSTYAIHSTAMGFKGDSAMNVFAGVGLDFNTKTFTAPATKGVVNASAFRGISFYAKGSGMIWVKIATAISDPSLGCVASATVKCYDLPYKQITLTSTWTSYQILWGDLKQDMFGTPETVTGAGIGGIHFENKGMAPAVGAYDIWIDDLKFF